MRVIQRYAQHLKACQGKLVLVGVSEPVYHQLEKTGLLAELGGENVYRHTSILGDSTRQAYQDAVAWLAKDHATEA
jgi:SulP family sulfate permease